MNTELSTVVPGKSKITGLKRLKWLIVGKELVKMEKNIIGSRSSPVWLHWEY